jgi:hypothetical protein
LLTNVRDHLTQAERLGVAAGQSQFYDRDAPLGVAITPAPQAEGNPFHDGSQLMSPKVR